MKQKNRNVSLLNFQVSYYVEYQLHETFLSIPTEAEKGVLGGTADQAPASSDR